MARYLFEKVLEEFDGDVLANKDVCVYLAGTATAAKVYLTKDAETATTTVPQVTTDTDGVVRFWIDSADYSYRQAFRLEVISGTTKLIFNDLRIVEQADMVGVRAEDVGNADRFVGSVLRIDKLFTQMISNYGGNFTNFTPPTDTSRPVLAVDTNSTNPGVRIYVYVNNAWRYVDLTTVSS